MVQEIHNWFPHLVYPLALRTFSRLKCSESLDTALMHKITHNMECETHNVLVKAVSIGSKLGYVHTAFLRCVLYARLHCWRFGLAENMRKKNTSKMMDESFNA